jgi:hypothetical protein
MAEEFFPWPQEPLVFWPRMKERELARERRRATPGAHASQAPVYGPDA